MREELAKCCNIKKKIIFTGILVISWKTNTSESKIYTPPSHIMVKFGINIGPIAKLFFFFCKFLSGVSFKYMVLQIHPHHSKKGALVRFFLITPLKI
jgi:hypothetical protein